MTPGYYVYAITGPGKDSETNAPISSAAVGAGAGPVHMLAIAGLRVVTSTIADRDILPVRRNTIGHTKVLEELMTRGMTALPMRFGVVVDDLASIARIVTTRKSHLVELIAGLEGKIEVGITVRFNRDALFQSIISERPQVGARGRGFLGKPDVQTYHERVALGQEVENLIRQKTQADRKEALERIAPFCLENKELKVQDDMTVLRTACLVRSATEPKLFDAVDSFAKLRPNLCEISYLAPVPPYNFVRANLDWGHAPEQER